MNPWMNLIKETFINGKGDHHTYHQWFGMPYMYVIRHSKRTGYYFKISNAIFVIVKSCIQQGGVVVLKALKTLYEKALFLVTVF